MPKKRVKYSSDPNDRMKNKDGTVKRFPYELFPGDVVIRRYGWRDWGGGSPDREVEALIGENRVKFKDIDRLDYASSYQVKRKAY
jgi:hypothetical protein